MFSPLKHAALVLLACFAIASCSSSEETNDEEPEGGSSGGSSAAQEGGDAGSSVVINGNDALTWGDGPYGVVLAHGSAFDAASWQDQATEIADTGATVVAVEDISPEAIQDAVIYLQDEAIDDVALVGGSAGADAILDLASNEPDLPDQLILLSPNSTVEGLGEEPKLFIASEEESVAEVSTELAQTAPGSDNEATLLPGSAHAQNIFDTDQAQPVLDAILERVQKFADS